MLYLSRIFSLASFSTHHCTSRQVTFTIYQSLETFLFWNMMSVLCGFHNWRTRPLRSGNCHFVRTLAFVLRWVAPVVCENFVVWWRAWILNMFEIQVRPFATVIGASYLTIISTIIVQRCLHSQECCRNSLGCKMIRILVCMCCTTMRVLCNMSHIILQRCTTIAGIFHQFGH